MNMKLLFLTTLAVGAIAAPAHAAEAPAKVTSDAINGVTFLGTQTPDSVTFSLVGGKLVADAAKPLTAGVGCLTAAGDNTKVSCTIFAGRPIEAFASGGSDKLTNLTAIDSFFHGGAGDDKLIGGFGRDQLFGDAGDFDTVQGRVGADLLSGG